jgi:hypothetical protein
MLIWPLPSSRLTFRIGDKLRHADAEPLADPAQGVHGGRLFIQLDEADVVP